MIGAGDSLAWQQFARQCPEPPLHAVADDGAADLPGDGDAEPHLRLAVLAIADEEDEAGHRRSSSLVRRQEIRAAGEIGQADSFLRPRLRRAARTLRPPTVAARARKPCRRLRTRLL